MASCPDGSGLLAAGAYSGVAALYDQHSMELTALLQGHTGGLTQACSPSCLHMCKFRKCLQMAP